MKPAKGTSSISAKTQRIVKIWSRQGKGAISLPCFTGLTSGEAFARESLIIEVLSVSNLTNINSGQNIDQLGLSKRERCILGTYLLFKAFAILLLNGESQIAKPSVGKKSHNNDMKNMEQYIEKTKRYRCKWAGCNFATNRSDNIITHLRKHTGEKDTDFKRHKVGQSLALAGGGSVSAPVGSDALYSCKWNGCAFQTKRSDNLDRHMYTHTGKTPYICEVENCGKGFTDRYKLTEHKRIHTGFTPYKCAHTGCTFSTIYSTNLKQHLRKLHGHVNTGLSGALDPTKVGQSLALVSGGSVSAPVGSAAPYSCKWNGCAFQTKRSNNLKRHMYTHTGKTSYICEVENCGKGFTDRYKLTEHKRIHTGFTPYKCAHTGCTFSTIYSTSLKQHLRKLHGHVNTGLSGALDTNKEH